MFKRLLSATALLVLCVGVCIACNKVIEKISLDLIDMLNLTSQYLESGEKEKAAKAMKKCEDKWEKYNDIYSVILNHKKTDNLNISIPSVRNFILNGNKKSAAEKIEESINGLNQIINEQRLSIANVL